MSGSGRHPGDDGPAFVRADPPPPSALFLAAAIAAVTLAVLGVVAVLISRSS